MARHVVILGAEADTGADLPLPPRGLGVPQPRAVARPVPAGGPRRHTPLRPVPDLRRRRPRRVRWPIPVLAAVAGTFVLI
ncbi:MAG TPA: hypothetical protein VKR22_11720, partial [Acidimicrobiales bacterium]|nr:hypothetical protein [Acidimicrobiales bacterium]